MSLLYRPNDAAPFTERKPTQNKLLKNGQVFTLLNLIVSDAGTYTCEAKAHEHGLIRQIRRPQGIGLLLLSRGKLKHI